MRKYARVIVEQLHGHWSAWFADVPHASFGGEHPANALRRLIDASGEEFDEFEILADDECTRDGHLEFLLQYRNREVIPEPSRN